LIKIKMNKLKLYKNIKNIFHLQKVKKKISVKTLSKYLYSTEICINKGMKIIIRQ